MRRYPTPTAIAALPFPIIEPSRPPLPTATLTAAPSVVVPSATATVQAPPRVPPTAPTVTVEVPGVVAMSSSTVTVTATRQAVASASPFVIVVSQTPFVVTGLPKSGEPATEGER